MVLARHDRWAPQRSWVLGTDGKLVPKQQNDGAADVAFTPIEKWLGVRWLWPGELGIDVIGCDKIRWAPFQPFSLLADLLQLADCDAFVCFFH